MTAAPSLRVVAVLDGTSLAAEQHARALGGFLRSGLRLPEGTAAAATALLFFADDTQCDCLVASAPARDVRLVRLPAHRPDLVAGALTACEAGGGADLYVFPGGPAGTESAARLAARTGGAALTDVLDAEAVADDRLVCRRAVFSGHLSGCFELHPRPWCITLDASWSDSGVEPPAAHAVQTVGHLGGGGAPAPFEDVELLESPRTGDLEAAAFIVVAGRGAGGREGVSRIAAAAARMGAVFGVTRPVAMNGWAAPDRQIGVSGTRTAPAVCLVAGASGAPAFLWGIERAGFIAAVDTDRHAPIAREADVVVVDDAVAVVEALADLLAAEAGAG